MSLLFSQPVIQEVEEGSAPIPTPDIDEEGEEIVMEEEGGNKAPEEVKQKQESTKKRKKSTAGLLQSNMDDFVKFLKPRKAAVISDVLQARRDAKLEFVFQEGHTLAVKRKVFMRDFLTADLRNDYEENKRKVERQERDMTGLDEDDYFEMDYE